MDLKSLNKIDIKDLQNIDWSRAKEWMQSQPGLIINSLLIFVTVMVVSSTYSGSVKATKSLQEKRAQLQEKLRMLEKSNAVEIEYKSFVQDIRPPIEADELISTLSEFAIKRDVRILSFSPAEEVDSAFVTVTSVEVNVASEDYANIVLFMRDIESSPYLLRIGKWTGVFVISDNLSQQSSQRPNRSYQQPADETSTPKFIRATIKIELVELKNV